MRKPSIEQLAPELAAAARTVAETLATAGQRAWIVGGAVRDLALGRAPKEVDMASAAPP
ncbi:MAG: polynucleotide adenylyltransferase PcnB, partial [Planctomycetota bacterium]|nr:polynucleotide adenylyltransferase PcnB [Planctomycetota bacterium]